jgi:hypothetical protein
MTLTQQINIDVTDNKAAVLEFNNGMPVPPAKNLDLNALSLADRQKVNEAITIIQNNAT